MTTSDALVPCASRLSYLHEILVGTSSPTGRVPILGSAGDAAQLAVDLGAQVGVAEARPPEGDAVVEAERALSRLEALHAGASRVVLAVRDEYTIFAAALAALSGRRLVLVPAAADIEETLRRLAPDSATVVATPDAITAECIARLVGLGGPPTVRCALGVLTARTPEAISRAVARSLLLERAPRTTSLTVLNEPVEHAEGDDHSLVCWDDFGEREARRIAEEPQDLVALTSHGDSIDLNLNDIVLCGRPTGYDDGKRRAGSLEHTCMAQDHCPRTRGGEVSRLAADRLRCKVLFAETCSGIAVRDRLLPGALSVALSTLDGEACAYLSTIKVVRSTGAGALLVGALLDSGVSLGEATRILEAFHHEASEDAPSFLLLGDADARFSPRALPRRISGRLDAAGTATAPEAAGFRGRWLQIDLHGDHAEALAREPDLLVHVSHIAPEPRPSSVLNAIAVRNTLGAPISVLLFSARPFAVDEITLHLKPGSSLRQKVADAIARLDRRLYQLDAIRAHLAALTGHRATAARRKCAEDLGVVVAEGQKLVNSGLEAFQAAQHRVTRVPSEPRYSSLLSTLQGAVGALDAVVARELPSWDMPHYQVPLYSSILFAAGPEKERGACYRCGLPAFELTFHCYSRPELRRLLTHCPGCDVLFDRLDDELPVEIHGSEHVRRGTTSREEIVVVNDTDEPRTFGAAVCVEGRYAWFQGTFMPESQSFEVPPRATLKVPFEVTIGAGTAPGLYHLTVFTTSGLSWCFSVKSLIVTR